MCCVHVLELDNCIISDLQTSNIIPMAESPNYAHMFVDILS